MKKIVPTLVLVMASIGFLGGCVSLNSSSISDVSNASSGQPVKVTGRKDLTLTVSLVGPKGE